ncbi:MAG: hypothetical protein AAFX76_05605 [Planctomycetota bacterium]
MCHSEATQQNFERDLSDEAFADLERTTGPYIRSICRSKLTTS